MQDYLILAIPIPRAPSCCLSDDEVDALTVASESLHRLFDLARPGSPFYVEFKRLAPQINRKGKSLKRILDQILGNQGG